MTGFPATRVVVLPVGRLSIAEVALGKHAHGWVSSAGAGGCAIRAMSSAATPGSTAPPPPGSKPKPAASTNAGTVKTPASSGKALTDVPAAATPTKSRSSRLPTLLLLVAPVAAYSTYGMYEQNLPEEVKPYTRKAKDVADVWVQQAQGYIAPAVDELREQLRGQLSSLGLLSPEPQAPAASVPAADTAAELPASMSTPASTPAPALTVTDSGEQESDRGKLLAELEEQAEQLVEVVDVTLLDQLLTDALVSDIDASIAPAPAAAAVLPSGPDLEHAAQQLQAVLAPSDSQDVSQSPSGGVDADHHVPAAHDLLSSVAAELGVAVDLSPAGLVKNAETINAGAGSDWQNFAAQHRQATADALAFVEALRQVKEFHAQKVAELQAKLDAAASTTEQVRKDAEHMAERLKGVLKLHQEQAVEDTKLAVHRAEQELMAAHAQHVLQERRERLAVLDQTRTKLNQVATFAAAQVSQSVAASRAQQLFVNILSFQQALDSGASLTKPLQNLRSSCKGDEVAQLALQALPRAERLPTGADLIQSLTGMRRHVASLSFMPEGGGGILATGLAYLASSLKFKETSDPSAATLSTDSAVTLAEQLLLQRDFAAAADVVEKAAKGTAAAAFVQPWVTQARNVAIAQQTLQLLLAQTSVVLAAGPTTAV